MIIILGDGGHAKVVRDALNLESGVLIRPWNFDVTAGDDLTFGMGSPTYKRELVEIHGKGRFTWVFDRRVIIAPSAHHGHGLQLMAGAIVQAGVELGDHVLVNTGAQIDHDCVISDYCHIGPGAILCGNVTLGDDCVIGAGTVVVQGVTLDAGTIIPAGSLVVGPDDLRRPQRYLRGH